MIDERAIVTVHGVGNANPGGTISELAAGLYPEGEQLQRDEILLGKDSYIRVRATSGHGPTLFEMHWADIGRGASSVLKTLRYLVNLCLAALQVAQYGPISKPNPQPIRCAVGIFRWSFEAIAVWTVPVAIVAFLAYLPENPEVRILLIAAGAGGVLALSVALWPDSRMAATGGFGASVSLLVVMTLIMAGRLEPEGLVQLASQGYGYAQTYSGWLLFIPLVALVIRCFVERAYTVKQLATNFALCWIPLIMFSIASRIAWATATTVASWRTSYASSREGRWISWQDEYLKATDLSYTPFSWGKATPMAELEFRMYGAMLSIALVLWAGVAVYALLRWLPPKNGRYPRVWAHRAYFLVLLFSPALMLSFSLLCVQPQKIFEAAGAFLLTEVDSNFIFSTTRRSLSDQSGGTDTVAVFYLLSATRAAPFVLLIAPRLMPALAVAGDILFYLCPSTSRLSTRERIEERLDRLLGSLPNDCRLTVVSHSQGTVIATNALERANCSGKLLTLGSPIDSLYSAFLGVVCDRRSTLVWWNYVRRGDYIGGVVTSADKNLPHIGETPGGHVGYWGDPYVAMLIKNLREEPQP